MRNVGTKRGRERRAEHRASHGTPAGTLVDRPIRGRSRPDQTRVGSNEGTSEVEPCHLEAATAVGRALGACENVYESAGSQTMGREL